MHLRTAVALALLAFGLVPAAAHATSVRIAEYEEGDDRYDVYTTYTLEVTGNTGEANRVVFREPEPGVFVVEDRGSKRTMIAGNACRRTARRRVVCRADPQVDEIAVSLRDRDDSFSARGRGASVIAVSGGPGRDRISSERTELRAAGGTGDDTLVGSSVADSLGGGPGRDVLRGNGGGDALEGGQGDDNVYGGTGDDTLGGNDERGLGRDLLDGGRGHDTVSYSDRTSAVRVDLRRQRGGRAGTEDRYRSIEGALGGNGDDVLLGSDRADELSGYDGADLVSGRGGNDTLIGEKVLGGKGDDTLTYTDRTSNCGEGIDRVVLPEQVAFLNRSCELLSLATGRGPLTVPARPVAMTDDVLTFELLCDRLDGCRNRRLRLLETTRPATTGAPVLLADVEVPDTPAYERVLVAVPRTGALAAGPTGRSMEVAVDARTSFQPIPPSANALGVYRVTLDL